MDKMTVIPHGDTAVYYQLPEGAAEMQDLIEHLNMNFAQGNIFKAIYRLGRKEGTTDIYDLNKIIWYAQREIKRLGAEQWVSENEAPSTTGSTMERLKRKSRERRGTKPGARRKKKAPSKKVTVKK